MLVLTQLLQSDQSLTRVSGERDLLEEGERKKEKEKKKRKKRKMWNVKRKKERTV